MNSPADQVVRISVYWIVVGVIAIVALGMSGGILAQQFFRTPLPLRGDTDSIVTTVQAVTISPNTAAAQPVESVNRSVLLLGKVGTTPSTIVGTGVVLTNDGVVVTTAQPSGELQAYDQEGRTLPLEHLGNDILFGLSYFRVTSNVVVPLDVRQTDAPVGTELLVLSRSVSTFTPRVKSFRITEYTMPGSSSAAGVQRMITGVPLSPDESTVGSPLIDEEGKVAGLLTAPNGSSALPVGHVSASLQRLTSNQREYNPFATLGFEVVPTLKQLLPAQGITFGVEVMTVLPTSSAGVAGLTKGDVITAVGNDQLDWQRPVAVHLSGSLPLTLRIMRKNQEQTLTLQAQPSPVTAPLKPGV